MSGFVAVRVLNAANPDAVTVRANVARIHAGEEFDARYVSSLGADAAPALVEALPLMDASDRRVVEDALRGAWATENAPDPRTRNLARTGRARSSRAPSVLPPRVSLT